ncbi:hypothetical protein [Rhizobium ruizarguesonis]|uniref:hypothetical protein n=1 Tax=Rhizobium ruizarguesonis TaxID=2081791 RepID=UPI00102F5927|nr:hypothetical protein [Rhizobium ruizarguesonis]TBD43329.1 hypothetical protein ELH19_14405 [Rhizobium ruizarguesonis]
MKKKRSFWNWLNPLTWIEGLFQILAAVFAPILRFLGMLNPPSAEGCENIQRADVEDAKKLAEEQEAAVDAITRETSPAEVVRAYARADAADRAVMDLSVLGMDEQDWLLRLSDEDLDLLGMSTTTGCARSLKQRQVLPSYAKPQPELEAAEILMTPTDEEVGQAKMDFIATRFRELYLAPGVANPNPRYVPTTVH